MLVVPSNASMETEQCREGVEGLSDAKYGLRGWLRDALKLNR